MERSTIHSTIPALGILLVDDNSCFLDLMNSWLGKEDWLEIVGLAGSGLEAISRVSELWPDLILMDISMPGMSGLEATQQIKARPWSPRIIIVTMSNDPLFQEAARMSGADGFITKSNLNESLLPLIHSLFADHAARVPADFMAG